MAPSTKANYKTYEAQARLVRAMVAAHPETKWNYKGKINNFIVILRESFLSNISTTLAMPPIDRFLQDVED